MIRRWLGCRGREPLECAEKIRAAPSEGLGGYLVVAVCRSAGKMRDENPKKSKSHRTLIESLHYPSGRSGQWRANLSEKVACTVKKSRTEDNGPAKKWLWLIRKTLNSPDTCGSDSYHTPSPVPDPILELNADFERSTTRQKNSAFLHRRSFHSLSRSLRIDGDTMVPQPMLDRRFSVCDRVSFGSRPSDFDSNFRCEGSSDDENIGEESPTTIFFSPFTYGYGAPTYVEERDRLSANSR
ncbi:hypothetical protein BHE74_00036575 [Ensete ventricosum]|nr:hypothetical protein BHE74_00036575 [Ensete ventricosum]